MVCVYFTALPKIKTCKIKSQLENNEYNIYYLCHNNIVSVSHASEWGGEEDKEEERAALFEALDLE